MHQLTPEQLNYRLRNGRLTFSNYVDWMTAKWVKPKHWAEGNNKRYRLTNAGLAEARRLSLDQGLG